MPLYELQTNPMFRLSLILSTECLGYDICVDCGMLRYATTANDLIRFVVLLFHDIRISTMSNNMQIWPTAAHCERRQNWQKYWIFARVFCVRRSPNGLHTRYRWMCVCCMVYAVLVCGRFVSAHCAHPDSKRRCSCRCIVCQRYIFGRTKRTESYGVI